MLGSVPADAVDTTALQTLHISVDLLLHAAVLGLEVFHADLAVSDLITVVPIRHTTVIVIQVGVLPEVGHIVQVAVGVVGHDVDDDLHTILMSLGAECS